MKFLPSNFSKYNNKQEMIIVEIIITIIKTYFPGSRWFSIVRANDASNALMINICLSKSGSFIGPPFLLLLLLLLVLLKLELLLSFAFLVLPPNGPSLPDLVDVSPCLGVAFGSDEVFPSFAALPSDFLPIKTTYI